MSQVHATLGLAEQGSEEILIILNANVIHAVTVQIRFTFFAGDNSLRAHLRLNLTDSSCFSNNVDGGHFDLGVILEGIIAVIGRLVVTRQRARRSLLSVELRSVIGFIFKLALEDEQLRIRCKRAVIVARRSIVHQLRA